MSNENLESIKRVDGEFIVGMRIAALGKKRPELYDRSKFTRVMDGFEVLETQFDDDRGIVTWSRERAERDSQVRQDILDKIGVKLSKKKVTAKTFVSNSNYHFFLKGLDKGQTPELDPDKIRLAESRDCFYAIVTNAKDKTPVELFTQYKELWMVEDCFAELKGTPRARPIFHWTDKRIVGHLTP